MQVKELAMEVDPTHPATVTVEAIEDFYELKEKGGILGKKNIRVFFGIDKQNPRYRDTRRNQQRKQRSDAGWNAGCH
jgi:hypothetical protein